MKIIKRSGEEMIFDAKKIRNAVEKANLEVIENERLSDWEMDQLTATVEKRSRTWWRIRS